MQEDGTKKKYRIAPVLKMSATFRTFLEFCNKEFPNERKAEERHL